MTIDVKETVSLIVNRLNDIVPITEDSEGLLLAGKTIDLMANQSYLALENVVNNINGSTNRVSAINDNLTETVKITYDQIDSLVPLVKTAEDSLLVAKAAMAVNGGINGWLIANQPDNQEEIINLLKQRNEITINLMTNSFNTIISKTEDSENIMLLGKAVETLLNLSSNSDSSGAITVIISNLQMDIDKIKNDMRNLENRVNAKIDLVKNELLANINSVDNKVTNLTNTIEQLRISINEIASNLTTHVANIDNPHVTTKSHVNLANVDNFSSSADLNDSSLTKFALAKSTFEINRKATDNTNKITTITAKVNTLETEVDNKYPKTGGAISGDVNITGTLVVGGNISAFSDARLKENVNRLRNCLQGLSFIKGYRYNFKGSEKRVIGLLAQEVEEIFPELIEGEEIKSIMYGNLTAILVEAINELSQRINIIDNTILKNKLSRGH